MYKILFIINPKSGLGKQKSLKASVIKNLDYKRFVPDFIYTQKPGHGYELAQNAVKEYDVIVAVGGDGTVNEVSKGLVNSGKIFGIIPCGSGNGLARFLKVPMSLNNAIKTINQLNISLIDTCAINDKYFVNVAGIGFDAMISHIFDNYGKRGPISYVKIIIKEFFSYKPTTFSLIIDNETINEKAYLVTFANSSTYGNKAHIAPQAIINDGKIDVAIVKPFPYIFAPIFAIRLYCKTMHKSKYTKYLKTNNISMSGFDQILAHIDGDPVFFNNSINVTVNPLSLKVLTGSSFSKAPVISKQNVFN